MAVLVAQVLQHGVEQPPAFGVARPRAALGGVLQHHVEALGQHVGGRAGVLVVHHGLPHPEVEAHVVFRRDLIEHGHARILQSPLADPHRHVQPALDLDVLVELANLGRAVVDVDGDAPVAAFGIVLPVEDVHVRGEHHALQEHDVVFVVLADAGDGVVVEPLQLRHQVVPAVDGDGLVQHVVAAHDPAVGIAPGQLLPQHQRALTALRLHEHAGNIVQAVVAAQAGLAARRAVHIQDGVDAVLFAPVQHPIQHFKALSAEPGLRLLRQQHPGGDGQAHGIVAPLGHGADVGLPQVVQMPAGPEALGEGVAADVPDQPVEGAPGGHALVQPKALGHTPAHITRAHTQHEALGIGPVARAPAAQQHLFPIAVDGSDAVRAQKALDAAVVKSIAHSFLQ